MSDKSHLWEQWRKKASAAVQVVLDEAQEKHQAGPEQVGYLWARSTIGENGVPPEIDEVIGGDWDALLKARGDLGKLWPGLIPDGGVACPAGSFVMGSPPDERDRRDNETQHKVTLTRGFYIGKYPVIQRVYQTVMGENPSKFQEGEQASNHPVERVSWYDAVRFCNCLSRKAGLEEVYEIGRGEEPTVSWDPMRNGYRLPTEAEWEYAARSGGDTYRYAGSDDIDAVAWYYKNSRKRTHPVGSKKPNRWGVYDMSGNVDEWVQDLYDKYPGDTRDYVNNDSGSYRVNRGGSWLINPVDARVADRLLDSPSFRDNSLGFRLARTIP